jgi:hypothetical protein
LEQGKVIEAEQSFRRAVALSPSVKRLIDTRVAEIRQPE